MLLLKLLYLILSLNTFALSQKIAPPPPILARSSGCAPPPPPSKSIPGLQRRCQTSPQVSLSDLQIFFLTFFLD